MIEHLTARDDVAIRAASRVARNWPKTVDGRLVDYSLAATLSEACQGVDAVVNLAAMPEPECVSHPHLALAANAGGTLSWARAAANAGVRRFVQMSTYKVYGQSPVGTVTENTPTKPESHYAIVHRAAEDYARSQHSNTVVFRLANGFGAPVDRDVDCWGIIVNEFCKQAVAEGRISIRSSGESWRNFVPLADIVVALETATRNLARGTYNLGAGRSMTIVSAAQQVAGVCRSQLGFTPDVSVGPAAPHDRFPELDYSIAKLGAAGVTPAAEFGTEVARTLEAARTMFDVTH
ncbi:MAG: SDR family oxidoreductase [Gemmatimonadaceae bacterium]|nr:SDR family oxidoreductase [Gemmatimonadaceae bacterium]